MTAQDIATISASVIALVQVLKGFGVPKWLAPSMVLFCSICGVGLYAWSMGEFVRTQAFDYFAATILVMVGAAGVFGLVRHEPRDSPVQTRDV